MRMLTHRERDFEAQCRSHRWQIPEQLNIAQVCCDRHLDRAHEVAIFHETEQGEESELTFAELKTHSDRLATALRNLGIERGERVAIILPQCPEAGDRTPGHLQAGGGGPATFGSVRPRRALLPIGGQWRTSRPIRATATAPHGEPARQPCRAHFAYLPGSTSLRPRFLEPDRRERRAARDDGHRCRRPGAAHLHLRHHRSPQRRPGGTPFAPRPTSPASSSPTNSSRNPATASGPRPTGRGPADSWMPCFLRSTTVLRSSAIAAANSTLKKRACSWRSIRYVTSFCRLPPSRC